MKFKPFKCAVCQGAATAIGYICLCTSPASPEVQRLEPAVAPIVVKGPELMHGVESEIERQLVMRPVPAITTSSTITPPTESMTLTGYPPTVTATG